MESDEDSRPASDPNPWHVIGLLTCMLLTLTGWTSNLITVVPKPRLFSQFHVAATMCGLSLAWCLWMVAGRRLSRAMGLTCTVLGVLALAGLGLALAS